MSTSFLDGACPPFPSPSCSAAICNLQHLFCVQKTRGAEFGEVPGKASPFSILCAMGAVVPLCPHTDGIATVERTAQDLVSHGQE